jgi:hypothetical protein
MIEPELAFADLTDDMACATAYLQYVVCCFHIFSIVNLTHMAKGKLA